MKANDSLYQLIHSLNKTEKTYFRKFAKRFNGGNDSTYLKLFDSLHLKRPNGSYSEKDIKAKFCNEKFIRQLPVTKNYLFSNILKSLTQYYEEDNIDLKLSGLISAAGVLYKKELFKACLTVTSRAKQLAEKFQKDIKLLELIHMERLALRVYSSLNLSSSALLKNYDEEIEIVKRLENVSRYKKIFDELIILATAKGPAKNETERQAFNDILNMPLVKDETRAICLQSQIVFHQIRCFALKLLNRADESCKHGTEVIRLIEGIDSGKKIYPYDYLVALQNMVIPGKSENMRIRSDECLQKLKNEQDNLLTDSPSKVRIFLKLRTLSCEINLNMAAGEYAANEKLIDEMLSLSSKNTGDTFRDEEVVSHLIAAINYFGLSQYEKSIYYINKIYNSSSYPLREDMLRACRLFKPIIHFELGNFESLDYYLVSTYGYLKKRNLIKKTERIMINLLKKLQNISDPAKYRAAMISARMELEASNEIDSFGPFDVLAWIESKLSGISYPEAIKNNYLKSI